MSLEVFNDIIRMILKELDVDEDNITGVYTVRNSVYGDNHYLDMETSQHINIDQDDHIDLVLKYRYILYAVNICNEKDLEFIFEIENKLEECKSAY